VITWVHMLPIQIWMHVYTTVSELLLGGGLYIVHMHGMALLLRCCYVMLVILQRESRQVQPTVSNSGVFWRWNNGNSWDLFYAQINSLSPSDGKPSLSLKQKNNEVQRQGRCALLEPCRLRHSNDGNALFLSRSIELGCFKRTKTCRMLWTPAICLVRKQKLTCHAQDLAMNMLTLLFNVTYNTAQYFKNIVFLYYAWETLTQKSQTD
jgi:Ca2+/Na+ antiporter